VKDVVLSDKTGNKSAAALELFSRPSVALFLVACLLLLGASAFFLGQRIKTATRYGDISSRLLQGEMPVSLLIDTIKCDWKRYDWGIRLLVLGVFELIIAVLALFMTNTSAVCAWGTAILLPITAYLLFRASKFAVHKTTPARHLPKL
jgi:hypothetical protein